LKKIVFLEPAVAAMRRHRNMAKRISDKLRIYAENPAAIANQVTELKGRPLRRLRVGTFRVLFEESETEIIVSDIGPRGSIYE
jgi:mRNA interferase RelE/StbE